MLKPISIKRGISKLDALRTKFQDAISKNYEFRAESCLTCTTPGACCLDAHFVNVHISPLEAEAIRCAIDQLPGPMQSRVFERLGRVIDQYNLSIENAAAQTYACPLFERGIGCLVHTTAKPGACIHHACYEKKGDCPPDELLVDQETLIDDLNRRVYGQRQNWLPIPLAIKIVCKTK